MQVKSRPDEPLVADRPALDLRPIFQPTSIAIVGASERVGYVVGANRNLHLINYPGAIYPVNPTRTTIWDMPCYPSVAKTPTVPELAFISVEKERVMPIVEECAAVGVKALIVNSNGYADHPDPRGRAMQDELAAFVREHRMLMVGPNVLGVVNMPGRFATLTFNPHVEPGHLVIISHSGGNTMWLAQAAYERHLGISYMISSGNEAVLNLCDFIEYLLDQPSADMFCLYIETIREPERFLKLASKAAAMNKPIVAVKVGRSSQGRKAALAHTGSFTGADEFVDALFARAGVIRASGMDEAVDKCILFGQLPPERRPRGRRIGVFTIGGGLASMTADLAAAHGLELPPVPASLATDLRAAYPEKLTIQNPIDTPAIYAGFMDTGAAFTDQPQKLTTMFAGGLAADSNFDGVVIGASRIEDPTKSSNFLRSLDDVVTQTGKPVVLAQPTAQPMSESWHQFMNTTNLAVVASVERAIVAYEAAARFAERRTDRDGEREPHPGIAENLRSAIEKEIAAGKKVASHSLTYALLEAFGLPIVRQALVTSADAAVGWAEKNGYPVVVKLPNSDTTTHKTELGAVRTNLRNASEVAAAAGDVLGRSAQASGAGMASEVVVQKMVPAVAEIFVGASNPGGGFPPAVLVGVGGILVEATRDVSMELTPVDAIDARGMVEKLRAYPVIRGFRGRPPADVAAIVDAITQVSAFAQGLRPYFAELDINPAMVGAEGQGLRIVDAVLTYQSDSAVERNGRERDPS